MIVKSVLNIVEFHRQKSPLLNRTECKFLANGRIQRIEIHDREEDRQAAHWSSRARTQHNIERCKKKTVI